MLFTLNMFRGNQVQVTDATQVLPMLRSAGFPALTTRERLGLSILIQDAESTHNFGAMQGAELMEVIREYAARAPRAFDDLALLRPRTRLEESGETSLVRQEIHARIGTTQRSAMERFLRFSASTNVDRELALYGFCQLGAYILRQFGRNTLYVCLGRSPTAIAAWLQCHTPQVCLLPFSSARIAAMTETNLEASGPVVSAHFDNMLRPHLQGRPAKILLIDYSTSGESLLTAFNFIYDYLQQQDSPIRLECLSLWQSKSAKVGAEPGMQPWVSFTKQRTRRDSSYTERLSRTLFGDRRIQHLYLKESIEDQFGLMTYSTRWSVEKRETLLRGMMNFLNNQALDFLSPYKKAPVLNGIQPIAFMHEEGLKRFRTLQEEMLSAERRIKEFEEKLARLQPKPWPGS